MAKSLQRLFGPFQPGITNTAESSKCTPAAGTKAHVRYFKATNGDTVTHYLCVALGADVAANRLVDQIPILAGAEYERWVSWPVEAAEIICISADTAAKLTVTASGDLYTLG